MRTDLAVTAFDALFDEMLEAELDAAGGVV